MSNRTININTTDIIFNGQPIKKIILDNKVCFTKRYTITFANVYNGSTTTQTVNYGDLPTNIPAPYKNNSGDVYYNFIGWDKEIVPATEDTTYTAVFEEIPNTGQIWTFSFNKYYDLSYNGPNCLKIVPSGDYTLSDDGKSYKVEVHYGDRIVDTSNPYTNVCCYIGDTSTIRWKFEAEFNLEYPYNYRYNFSSASNPYVYISGNRPTNPIITKPSKPVFTVSCSGSISLKNYSYSGSYLNGSITWLDYNSTTGMPSSSAPSYLIYTDYDKIYYKLEPNTGYYGGGEGILSGIDFTISGDTLIYDFGEASALPQYAAYINVIGGNTFASGCYLSPDQTGETIQNSGTTYLPGTVIYGLLKYNSGWYPPTTLQTTALGNGWYRTNAVTINDEYDFGYIGASHELVKTSHIQHPDSILTQIAAPADYYNITKSQTNTDLIVNLDLGTWALSNSNSAYWVIMDLYGDTYSSFPGSSSYSTHRTFIIDSQTPQVLTHTHHIASSYTSYYYWKLDYRLTTYSPSISLLETRRYQISAPTAGNFSDDSTPLRYAIYAKASWYDGWGTMDKDFGFITYFSNTAGQAVGGGPLSRNITLSGGPSGYGVDWSFGHKLQKYNGITWVDITDISYPSDFRVSVGGTGSSGDYPEIAVN